MRSIIGLFCIGLLGLGGCAGTPIHTSFLPSGVSSSLTVTQNVEFLYEKPTKEYQVIGKIIVEPRREWFIWENSGSVREDVLQAQMREKAQGVGSDAVIMETSAPYVSKTGFWSSTIHRLEGLAICWKK